MGWPSPPLWCQVRLLIMTLEICKLTQDQDGLELSAQPFQSRGPCKSKRLQISMAQIVLIIFLPPLPIFVIMSTLFLAVIAATWSFLWDPILLMEISELISNGCISTFLYKACRGYLQSGGVFLKIKYIS